MNENWLEALKNNGRLGGIAKGLAYQKQRLAIRQDFLKGCTDVKKLAASHRVAVITVYKYIQDLRPSKNPAATYDTSAILMEIENQNEFLNRQIEFLRLHKLAKHKIGNAL